MYFCTFTCFNWLRLIEITNGSDLVYNWFDILKDEKINTVAYVIMPDHHHCILHFPKAGFNLNNIIGNAKRFMAYEMVARLEQSGRSDVLQKLSEAVMPGDRKRCKLHQVFIRSFDGKLILNQTMLLQKIDYLPAGRQASIIIR